MNVILLSIVLTALPVDSSDIEQLFTALDRDKNGEVAASEVSESQRPYFRRALRVADRNEDGVLTKNELATAVTDPKATDPATTAGAPGRRGGFDIARLDRNKDGNISKDEVPAPLKDRFQRLFDQSGKDTVSISELQRFARQSAGQRPAGNGKSAPKMDSNQKRPDMMKGRPTSDNAGTLFDRMDRNRDGKLSRGELPERMKQNAERMDRDGDKAISKEEFLKAVQRRGQRSK